MKSRNIAYWVTTVLAAALLIFGGFNEVGHSARIMAVMGHLGYPAYLPTLLGTWKLLGAVAILTPRFLRLKEWAYAGIVFDVTGALFSHLHLGDGPQHLAPPFLMLVLAVASWSLRPAHRKLQVS